VFSNLEIMQYQYPASNQYWKRGTEPLRILLLSKQFGKTNSFVKQTEFFDQNLPTQIAQVFSNLEIMQYQYPASNQYWKSATELLRVLLLSKQFGKTNRIFLTKSYPLKLPKGSAI
jgi:hypothetical protein